MVKASEAETALNGVRRSRIAKAQMFMRDRKAFMAEMVQSVAQGNARQAQRFRLRGAMTRAYARHCDGRA